MIDKSNYLIQQHIQDSDASYPNDVRYRSGLIHILKSGSTFFAFKVQRFLAEEVKIVQIIV